MINGNNNAQLETSCVKHGALCARFTFLPGIGSGAYPDAGGHSPGSLYDPEKESDRPGERPAEEVKVYLRAG